MEQILSFFMTRPRRLISLGQACVTTAGLIIVFGVVGWAAKKMVGVAVHRAPNTELADSLSALFPTLWTWWVPETLLGALPALALIGLGFWIAARGRDLLRY